MLTTNKMQSVIGTLLIVGILISLALVIIGGVWYLLENGGNSLQTQLLTLDTYHFSIQQIWHTAFSLTPIGFIELGLLTLVSTQILRVALLTGFYMAIRDYWFTFFSFFILFVLIYSSFLRNG